MIKTPATVLQEMMIKLGKEPHYECVGNSGPDHMKSFKYSCSVHGVSVSGCGRTKKEAKQEAARAALGALAAAGLRVPPPYHAAGPAGPAPEPAPEPGPPRLALPPSSQGGARPSGRSYVALLRELCEEYRLGAVQDELVGDTGPAHLREFTVRARLGRHERSATASTKRAARQLAYERLYAYLRENLAAVTKDFVEEAALSRALGKAMERLEARAPPAWRADLALRVADLHLGEPEAAAGAAALGAGEPLERAAAALGLRVERGALAAEGGALSLLALEPSAPALLFAGRGAAAAERAAARYLRRALAARRGPAAGPLPASAPCAPFLC